MGNSIIEISAEQIIDYMLENNVGIRDTAKHFGCSVGTIWNRINKYDGPKNELIKQQFSKNLTNSHKNLKNHKG